MSANVQENKIKHNIRDRWTKEKAIKWLPLNRDDKAKMPPKKIEIICVAQKNWIEPKEKNKKRK